MKSNMDATEIVLEFLIFYFCFVRVAIDHLVFVRNFYFLCLFIFLAGWLRWLQGQRFEYMT